LGEKGLRRLKGTEGPYIWTYSTRVCETAVVRRTGIEWRNTSKALLRESREPEKERKGKGTQTLYVYLEEGTLHLAEWEAVWKREDHTPAPRDHQIKHMLVEIL